MKHIRAGLEAVLNTYHPATPTGQRELARALAIVREVTQPMKHYRYTEPDIEGRPVTKALSEEQILESYYSYWLSRAGAQALTLPLDEQRRRCIADWVTVNWADEAAP